MFERFTDHARRIVVLAQEEARMHRHSYIGTEHILLGLIHEGEGVAAQVLAMSPGVTLDAVRTWVREVIGEGGAVPTAGHIPFSPRCKKALEYSLREALQLGHSYIGTEHVLLGLIRDPACVAAQILGSSGVTGLRERVIAATIAPSLAALPSLDDQVRQKIRIVRVALDEIEDLIDRQEANPA
jgi:ATP-dependent Clp protease ATP-binding subunit ClpC